MINFANYFLRGIKNTLRLKNGTNFSYKGPWVLLYPDMVLDEWYVGDFAAAEYTIVADYGDDDKEIIKCLVVAGPTTANIVTYGRTNLGRNLFEITADITVSKLTVRISPVAFEDSTSSLRSKVIFSANYYHTLNEIGA